MKHIHIVSVRKAQEAGPSTSVEGLLEMIFAFVLDLVEAKGKAD